MRSVPLFAEQNGRNFSMGSIYVCAFLGDGLPKGRFFPNGANLERTTCCCV